ncbi:MAG: hypothetical protein EPN35_06700 [Rhodanobacter sp.]|nr:MAG: hypothetical protein EPN35_06700 [Rhodanobacter sp.]
MNALPKLPTKHPGRVAEPPAGGYVVPGSLPGRGDLSDWVELMEAVEALCPVWPEKDVALSMSKCLL